MSRRKINKEQIRKIQHSNGTYYITIPIKIMRSLKWRERQKVVVKKYGQNKILITDWPVRRPVHRILGAGGSSKSEGGKK